MDTDTKLEVFIAKVSDWMETTQQYRKDLRNKQDRLLQKHDDLKDILAKLPCGERKAWYQSMGRQVGFMWLVLGIILTAVIGAGFVGINRTDQVKDITSRIENRVGINTGRIDKLDSIHSIMPR